MISDGSDGSEQIGTSPKLLRSRGMAQASLDLIERMAEIAEAMHPITGRGIGYKPVRRQADPVNVNQGHETRLPPAQGSARTRHDPVGMDRG